MWRSSHTCSRMLRMASLLLFVWCLSTVDAFSIRPLKSFPGSRSVLFAKGGDAMPQSQSYTPPVDYDAGPPPDLPSLLLHNRIVYVGSPIVPAITELVVAQLLYLNYNNGGEMITMYINSPGTNAPGGKSFSFDNEAFAIADTMQFIRSPIRTICVGQAFGTAAMLLSLGQKGNRFALPNASIMLHQPKSRASGQATDVAIKAREILTNRKIANEILAQTTGRDLALVQQDTARAKYLSPEEAIAYGIIDKVLLPEDTILKSPGLAATKLLDLM